MSAELRRDRREREKRQRQQQQRRVAKRRSGVGGQLLIGAGVIGALVLIVLGLRAAGVFEPPAAQIDINSAEFQVPSGVEIGQLQPDDGTTHITPPAPGKYSSEPPTSGPHWSALSPAAPAPWGIKDATLPREVTTHNLEHGGIVIAYSDKLSSQEVDQLKRTVRALTNGAYRKIILEPYPLSDAKVALTAWRWLLKLQSIDQVQVVQFVRAHYADAKYAPEANVP